nr:NADH dehydrogenase subunit 6, mitochondrial [Tanacetum cinerariifolium]
MSGAPRQDVFRRNAIDSRRTIMRGMTDLLKESRLILVRERKKEKNSCFLTSAPFWAFLGEARKHGCAPLHSLPLSISNLASPCINIYSPQLLFITANITRHNRAPPPTTTTTGPPLLLPSPSKPDHQLPSRGFVTVTQAEMKAIQDATTARTIPPKMDREILAEVTQSINRTHIVGVGRKLAGTGNLDYGRSQPD